MTINLLKRKGAAAAKFSLSHVNITHVADTANPAIPDAVFAMLKSSDVPTGCESFAQFSPIAKVDTVKKQAFGYLLVPDIPDLQAHTINKTEVEGAMHSFMKNLTFGKADGVDGTSMEHKTFGGHGYAITSIIDTDGTIGKSYNVEPQEGAWFFGMQYTDDAVWDKVTKGEIVGWSVGGTAKYTPIAAGDAVAAKTFGEMGTQELINAVVGQVTGLAKEATSFDAEMATREMKSKMWQIFSAVEDSLRSIIDDDEVESKAAAAAATIDQFKRTMVAFMATIDVLTTTQKSYKHATEGESEMTSEEMAALTKSITDGVGVKIDTVKTTMDTRLTDFEKRLDAIEKKEPEKTEKTDDDPDKKPTTKSVDDELDKITDVNDLSKHVGDTLGAFLKTLTPVIERLQKAATPRKGAEQHDGTVVTKTEEQIKKDASAEAFAGSGLDAATFYPGMGEE